MEEDDYDDFAYDEDIYDDYLEETYPEEQEDGSVKYYDYINIQNYDANQYGTQPHTTNIQIETVQELFQTLDKIMFENPGVVSLGFSVQLGVERPETEQERQRRIARLERDEVHIRNNIDSYKKLLESYEAQLKQLDDLRAENATATANSA